MTSIYKKEDTLPVYHQPNHAPPPYDNASQYSDHTLSYPDQHSQYDDQYNPQKYPSSSPGTTIRFPTQMVFDSSWVSSTSYLGPTKDEHMFAVQGPSKLLSCCFSRGGVKLLDGTDKLSTPIASVGPEKGSKLRRTMIRVAPKQGAADQNHLEIVMSGDWRSTHPFTLPLGEGRPTEQFEWRSSRGKEVKGLAGSFNFGWKLVRLDGPVVVPGQVDGTKGYTSDGKEVVAVGGQQRLSRKHPDFMFMGAGARGELGETFEIVAVMGFLRLRELAAQQQAAASGSSSSASTSVAIS